MVGGSPLDYGHFPERKKGPTAWKAEKGSELALLEVGCANLFFTGCPESPHPSPLPTKQARAGSDKAAVSTPSSKVVTEKLTGYKTPCEYLTIQSRHYPRAVVAVSLPRDYHQRRGARYPLVIAFGGMGECVRPPRSGALAWIHYYKSDEAVVALETNHLESRHFRGLATPGDRKPSPLRRPRTRSPFPVPR